MADARHIVVTGAAGYVGRNLVDEVLADPALADASFTVTDLTEPEIAPDPRVRTLAADLTRSEDIATVLDGRADIVFHMAGLLGGAAERDPVLARRVNVDAPLDLIEKLRDEMRPPRLVFASSVAVFGPPLPDHVDDDTAPHPLMLYGAQKRMIEVAIEQASARGWIDGLALRLSGIVAHPHADARMRSAFLNTMFFDYAAGRDITLPLSAQGRTWLISIRSCVRAIADAGLVSADRIGRRRAMTLPTQLVEIGALVAALARRFPDSPTRVTYAPDAELEAQFAAFPPVTTALADGLDLRHDGNLDTLVARAFEAG